MSTTTESTRMLDNCLKLETDDQSTPWLAHVFQPFLMPVEVENGDSPAVDRFDWRFLGISSLKSSTYGTSEVSFFQVFDNTVAKQRASLSADILAGESLTSPSTTSGASTMTDEGDVSKLAPQLPHCTETNGAYSPSSCGKHTIVMSLNTQVFKPSKRQLYYIFPCDSIVETVNETPPYELFCSFHSLNCIPEQKCTKNKTSNTATVSATTNISPLDNHQGYTDIPSSSLLLTVTSGIKTEQASMTTSSATSNSSIIHLSLSGISQELYRIIKESVAGFENAYGKMIQLMKFHTEGVSHRHAELLVVNGNNGSRSKKSTIEAKSGKGKRKGSYQQRQTSPRSATATAITPTTSNLSSKAKPTTSTNDMDSPKEPLKSPPMPSHVATPSNSAPIIPSGTTASSTGTTTSHRHNAANGNGRKCHYCGSKSTPMWRRGPEGAGTLCNACGVKWKHGKILCGKQSSGSSSSDAALGLTSSPTPTSTKSANGYTTSKTLTVKEQKKRKQHVELKIKKDKRIKIKEQQQQRLKQQNSHSWHGNGMMLDAMMETDDEDDDDDDDDEDDDDDDDDDDEDQHGMGSNGFSDDDDFMGEYDEDDDERMNHNIVAARHLTIHEGQHYHHPYHNALSTGSAPPQPQSRSRSMTTSAANDYVSFQQQQQQQQEQQQQQQQDHQQQQQYQQQYQQNGWSVPNGFHHNQQQQAYSYQQQREEQQHRPRRHTADISVLDQVPWGEFPLSMGVDAVEAATVLTLLKRS